MNIVDYSSDFTEEELDEYLEMCFAVSGGFSKGTANVSANDVKKLHPLLKHYAKMKHPFTACVRDNRKRFGGKTEAYCAVLKDLIVGNTKWRGKGKKYTPHNLSENELIQEFGEFALEFKEGMNLDEFKTYLSDLTEGDIQLMIDSIPDTTGFAEGDVVWDYTNSFDQIRKEVREQLNEPCEHSYSGDEVCGCGSQYWVEDINSSEALVCYKYDDYFVVPYKIGKNGVTIAQEEDWKPVAKAWVETNLADEPTEVSELFFDDPVETSPIEDGNLIWKSIFREGEWQYSPGPRGAIKKSLKIVKSGPSDRLKNVISMEEIKNNFEQNAYENVTIPLSHEDKSNENTGYVRKLRYGKDAKGRHTLEAALEFTEPEIKEKILRKSIPNTSAGVLWNHIDKEKGTKYNTVIGHVALVPHPYITELAPFSEEEGKNFDISCFSEHEIDENVEVVTLSDSKENTNIKLPRGGEEVSTIENEPQVVIEKVVDRSFFEELNLSEDDIRGIVSEFASVKAEVKKNAIDAKGQEWQDAGKSPALVKAAKAILFADDESITVNFSETDGGKEETLSLSEIVEKLVAASPKIEFGDQISEEDAAGRKPDADASLENERANFSEDVLALAGTIWLEEGLSEEEALKEAVKRTKSE